MESVQKLNTFANIPLEKVEKDIFGKQVPKYVVFLIASFLKTPQDLRNLSLSCKKFATWINKDNQPWKNLAYNLFPSNSIPNNIKDHKQFVKNQTYLFNRLPTNLKHDKRTREKFKDVPQGTENNLCPSKLKSTSIGYTCVWQEQDGTGLLCKHETNELKLTEWNPETKHVTASVTIELPRKKTLTKSDVICASAIGKTLFVGINYKTNTADENMLGVVAEIPTGMVVLINKEEKSLITTISKEFRFVEELQFSDETSKVYVKFSGADKPWYCYNLNKAIKKSK